MLNVIMLSVVAPIFMLCWLRKLLNKILAQLVNYINEANKTIALQKK